MTKRIYLIHLILISLMLVGCAGNVNTSTSTSTNSPDLATKTTSVIVDMISQINESEILNTISSLQNFKTRMYGQPGNSQAAAYLYNQLSAIPGLSVEYQSEYKNVIATLPGEDSIVYMVGAHYDSISSDPELAPGATDNGAGCAIVLELARIMSQYQFNHTVKFAFWNLEERAREGSAAYVKYIQANQLKLALYHNFDSVAYDPDQQYSLDINYNPQSSWVSEMLTQHNALYNIDFSLTYNRTTCTSDHKSFWSAGYTATTTHSNGGSNNGHSPNAGTPYDTINDVSTVFARKNGQLVLSVLSNLAGIQNLTP